MHAVGRAKPCVSGRVCLAHTQFSVCILFSTIDNTCDLDDIGLLLFLRPIPAGKKRVLSERQGSYHRVRVHWSLLVVFRL